MEKQTTMKAAYIESFGYVCQIKIDRLPIPQVAPNEIRIKISYAAVNPVDWKIRLGHLKEALPHKFPIVLGWDAAGIVD